MLIIRWGHALNAPDVHIGKGDRNTLDYVENDRSPGQPKPGLRTEETLTSSKCIVLFFLLQVHKSSCCNSCASLELKRHAQVVYSERFLLKL